MLSGNPVFELGEIKKKKVNALLKESKAMAVTLPEAVEREDSVNDSVTTDSIDIEKEKREALEYEDDESVMSSASSSTLGSLPPLPSRQKTAVFSGVRAMTRTARMAAQANIAQAAKVQKELFLALSPQGRQARIDAAKQKHKEIAVFFLFPLDKCLITVYQF